MKEQIKELRVRIDGLSQLVKELKPIDSEYEETKRNSWEIIKAYDSLILAKAWLGKVLGELGGDTPYKNDGNRKTVEDIEKVTDKLNFKYFDLGDKEFMSIDIGEWNKLSHVEKVDWIREEIKDIIEILPRYRKLDESIQPINKDMSLPVIYTCIVQHLSEARFWLGFELQRIKENE